MGNRNLIGSGLFRNTAVLFSGTAIAQVIPLLLSPVLTRLYSPADFGTYYLFLSMVAPLAVVYSGRYDMAVMLPSEKRDAAHVAAVGVVVAGLLSLITAILVWPLSHFISLKFESPDVEPWLIWVPVAVFFMASYRCVSFLLIRDEKYKLSSVNKVVQTSATGASSVGMGWQNANLGGLIWSDLIGKGLLFIAGFVQVKRIGYAMRNINLSHMREMARRYAEYPKYNALPALADSLSLNIPVMMVFNFFGQQVTSFFNFSRQVIGSPLLLVSGSLSQVLFQRIARKKEAGESIRKMLMSTLGVLSLLALVYLAVIELTAEDLFAWAFGEPWRMAGYHARFLAISFALKFVISPLSIVFPALGAIKTGSIWQGVYFFAIAVLFFAGVLSIRQFLWLYVAIESVMYLIYLYLALLVVNRYESSLTK
ncbi:MAG: oligosaccharide flippase family protein [Flavobacteriales bacterium]|nr:oligosaccharide flippase family protein [Flavobacteriales bacterium]MCB9447726.1 oligosaccharide flippase family protein [Flavobacteriales bacterium]